MDEEKKNKILTQIVMSIGTNHDHLSFKDVFEVSESFMEILIEAQEAEGKSK